MIASDQFVPLFGDCMSKVAPQRCPSFVMLRKQLVALYEAIPHNGEPGSALRRECEATKALIRELETGHA